MRKEKLSIISCIAILLLFLSVSLTSCMSSEDPVPVPTVNKSVFTITNATVPDTLYMKDHADFVISKLRLHNKADGKVMCELDHKKYETELKDGNTVLGQVTYENGEFSKVTIDNWCELIKSRDKNNKKVYIMKPIGNRTDLYMYLGVFTQSGITVTVK
ncbi:hypothetical protein [Hoylesella enoeca]|uniref:hypothetical protein n=1 Tax=Hoylesella enoeca TaxID=76123 RepID=UPI0028890ECE|nr:hypothetical protein [Hoylesella enoeca]